ncbi:MAG: aminotransferase class III-fold pyridoxal phosphate-dependent enzyme, partial [Burkholderiales bacterium]
HGYTYSGHPMASAAAIATLDLYRAAQLFDRAKSIAPYLEEAIHSLEKHPNVIDVRNLGLIAIVEVAPRPGKPGARGYDVFVDCFQKGVLVRAAGDTLALSPPLIVEKSHVDQMVGTLGDALERAA